MIWFVNLEIARDASQSTAKLLTTSAQPLHRDLSHRSNLARKKPARNRLDSRTIISAATERILQMLPPVGGKSCPLAPKRSSPSTLDRGQLSLLPHKSAQAVHPNSICHAARRHARLRLEICSAFHSGMQIRNATDRGQFCTTEGFTDGQFCCTLA